MKTKFFIFALGLLIAASARPEPRPDEGTVYVPIGKRDPFKRPSAADGGRDLSAINPLEKFGIEQFILRAILRGTTTAQAMFEDPEGRVHIVAEGTVIGRERGTISRILNREVIVTERTVNYLGVTSLFERVLSLPSDDEVDQSAPSKNPSGGTGSKSGSSSGSGGGGSSGSNGVMRQVSQERNQAPPAAASQSSSSSRFNPGPNISNSTQGRTSTVTPSAPVHFEAGGNAGNAGGGAPVY